MTNTFIPYTYPLSTGTNRGYVRRMFKTASLVEGSPHSRLGGFWFGELFCHIGLGAPPPYCLPHPSSEFLQRSTQWPPGSHGAQRLGTTGPQSNLFQYLSFMPPLPHFLCASPNHTCRWDPQMEGPWQLQGFPRPLLLLWTPECW